MYELRFCRADEKQELKRFFGEDWAPGHILSRYDALLDFMYLDRARDRYNVAVLACADTGRFDGILGVIPTRQYDDTMGEEHLWLTTWKVVKERTQGRADGFDLWRLIVRQLQPRTVGGVGLTDNAVAVYRFLGYTTGTLHQWYYGRADLHDKQLSRGLARIERPARGPCSLRPVQELGELDALRDTHVPCKSSRFFERRYLQHPAYRYKVVGAYDATGLRSAFVIRRAEAEGACALRVVDAVGLGSSGCLQAAMQELLEAEGAEHLDMLVHGVAADALASTGLLPVTDDTIVPDWFEPFERKTIRLRYATSAPAGYQVFKGDADMDRPARAPAAA